jgi:hypothetical protein
MRAIAFCTCLSACDVGVVSVHAAAYAVHGVLAQEPRNALRTAQNSNHDRLESGWKCPDSTCAILGSSV